MLPKPIGNFSMSPKHGGPPTKISLRVKHPKGTLLSSEHIHLKAPIPSRDARAPTYIKKHRGGFWYPFPCGSTGVSISPNPNKITC